ncbi:MAG: DUF6266 family protein [Bacteroidota bacterium]|nr:DUF6266 family protein [Bacteroidota bacterium]
MSIAQNPLLGPMRKSMGNFTTMSYNGRNIVRSKAFFVKRKKTDAQKNQIQKMTLLAGVYRSFGGITDAGFVENRKGKSPYNLFISANFNSAFDCTGEAPVVSYPMVLVSKGTLPKVSVSGGVLESEGIRISYASDLSLPYVSGSDQLIAFIRTTKGELRRAVQIRGTEKVGSMLIPFPGRTIEEVVCCYVFALSADGKKSSKSVYVPLKSIEEL